MKIRNKTSPKHYEEGGEIVVRIGEQSATFDFIKDLKFSEATINESIINQTTKFAFWGNLAIEQRRVYEKKRAELEIFESKLYGIIRARMEREPGGRVTDSTVQMEVKRQAQRVVKVEELQKAKYQYEKLNHIKDCFEQRKYMLMALGANMREELASTDLRVMERKFAEEKIVGKARRRS